MFDITDMELDLVEDVEPIIKAAVNETLGNVEYKAEMVEKWSDVLTATIQKKIVDEIKKPFKFVITALIMQKNGAGLFLSDSCYWDRQVDGHVQVTWANNTIHAIVSVYATGVFPSKDPLSV